MVKATETPAQKKERLKNARLESEQLRLAEIKAQKEQLKKQQDERRALMPSILFALQVEVAQLALEGLDVSADVVLEKEGAWGEDACQPGVKFTFNRYGDTREETLNLLSEEWEIAVVVDKFTELKQEAEEKKRKKNLAIQAKEKLTPEELSALREYGYSV